MTREEFNALKEGDIIQPASGEGYVVTGNYGEWKIATRTITATNPSEWKLIRSREIPAHTNSPG